MVKNISDFNLNDNETRIDSNKRSIECNVINRSKLNRPAWNKGLTKYSDPRVLNNSESLKKHFQSRYSEIRANLQPKLDDDGKLYSRYSNKRVSAKQEGLVCELTFEEFLMLVDRAGLVSSQLGYKGQGYVLARYNDEGNYTIDNCRFITQLENARERKVSSKQRCASMTNAAKMQLANKMMLDSDPVGYKERIKIGLRNSAKNRERLQRLESARLDKQLKLNPSYSGRQNSQYGSFWITDGEKYNSKWREDKGELPEGYYKGRIMGLSTIHIE